MSEVVDRIGRRLAAIATILPGLFFAVPLVTCAIPRLTPAFLGVLGLVLIAAALRRGADWRTLVQPNAAFSACLVLSAYLFLNAIWAVDHGSALAKAAAFLGIVLLAFTATRAVTALDANELRRAALGFAVATALGAAFLLFELLTDGFLTRGAINLIAVLKPVSAKHIAMANGKVTRMNLSEFNQNAAMLMLNLWPGLLILGALKSIPRRIVVVMLFFLALAVPIALSEHDSSQLALVLSPVIFGLAWYWRSLVIRGLAVLWCLCFVFVIPLDQLAYQQGLHLAPWLPDSARARVIIWQYTAEHALEHPWLGIGVSSTSAVKAQTKGPEDRPEGFVFKRTTGQHAHDIFLQSWYELGLVGVVLAAIAGALVVLRIGLLPVLALPFGAASFMAFFAIAAFAWSIWQTWFMCAIALVPLYLRMGTEAVQEPVVEPPKPRRRRGEAKASAGGNPR
jgi:hypothetical protein